MKMLTCLLETIRAHYLRVYIASIKKRNRTVELQATTQNVKPWWSLTGSGRLRQLKITPEIYLIFYSFIQMNSQSLVLPISCYSGLQCGHNKSLIIIRSIICHVVANRRLRTKENFKLLALKLVAVVCERWWLTRSSKNIDMTWKHLVFWKNGHQGEAIAYERWLQPEVPLS